MSITAAAAAIVGQDNVASDEASRRLAGSDLFPWATQALPDLVVRPGSTAETAEVVAALTRAGHALVPRGGGLSYTGGVVPGVPAVVLDMARMDGIDIRADDLCAVVGAGCPWEKLAEALRPLGLRTTLNPPTSGSHSLVGGAVSQNLPGSMDGVVGLTVVLADGTVVRTGSWALKQSDPFWRHHGPDLTGMFIGDCGAFAVKTEIALRLERIKPAEVMSFTFATSEALLGALLPLMRQGMVTRGVILDRSMGDTAGKVGLGEAARTVAAMASQAGSIRQAIRDVAGLARMKADLAHAWGLHITVESATEAGARAQAEIVRAACRAEGTEIEPSLPKAMRARPFSIRGFLGPKGERWVPVHGIVPLSRAQECMAALEARIAERTPDLAASGISVNWLLSTLGAYLLIEPMIYWPDSLGPVHEHYLSDRDRQRFGGNPTHQEARDKVLNLRRDLRDLMDGFGAVHVQVGRFYRLTDAVDEGSLNFLTRIKRALDPDSRMNPGSLGLAKE